MVRRYLIQWLIRYVEHELYHTPVPKMDDEKMLQLYGAMWDLPMFRAYIVDRETRFVHTLAHTSTETLKGQRFENAALFKKCQHASQVLSKRSALPQGGRKVASPGKR